MTQQKQQQVAQGIVQLHTLAARGLAALAQDALDVVQAQEVDAAEEPNPKPKPKAKKEKTTDDPS